MSQSFQLNLPDDPTLLSSIAKNLYNALNKATLKGTFDLSEAHKLHNDFTVLAKILDDLSKLQQIKKTENNAN